MDFIEITEEPLKVDEISAQVTDKGTGATSLFVGTTR
jgi:molybdopterin synthase catalytic subunit